MFAVAHQVFLHPNSALLWKKYLLFSQSYFSNFTVSKVNSAYGKCLTTLSAVRDGSMVSHPTLPGTMEDMLGNRDFSLQLFNHFLCCEGPNYRIIVTYSISLSRLYQSSHLYPLFLSSAITHLYALHT